MLALRRKDLSRFFSAAPVAIKEKTSSSEFASFPEYDDAWQETWLGFSDPWRTGDGGGVVDVDVAS